MSSVPGYLYVLTAASTSPSVLAEFHWRTGWFVVWSRRCSQLYMSPQYPTHLLSTPSLSVTSLLSLSSMTAALYLVISVYCVVGLFAVLLLLAFD